MRVTTALLVVQAALSYAFVIPKIADISPEDLNVELSFSRVIRVPCTGCPTDVDSDLIFDFNLPGSNPKELSINGMPVIPVDVTADHSRKIMAPIVPKEIPTLDYFFNPDDFKKAEVGYALLITDSTRMHPVPSTIHSLELNTLTVNNQPVRIEGIAIDVHEDKGDGTLILGNGRMVPVSEQCGSNIKCMISKVMDKLHGVKARLGCGGKAADYHHKSHPHMGHGAGMGRGRFHGRPHHAHAHHRGESSFFARAFHQVLLPVFIGLLAGMAFGAFALVATHAFVALFRRCAGRRRERKTKKCRGCRFSRRMRRQELREQGNDEEKSALMAADVQEEVVNSEAPPAYDTEIAEGLEVVEKQ